MEKPNNLPFPSAPETSFSDTSLEKENPLASSSLVDLCRPSFKMDPSSSSEGRRALRTSPIIEEDEKSVSTEQIESDNLSYSETSE